MDLADHWARIGLNWFLEIDPGEEICGLLSRCSLRVEAPRGCSSEGSRGRWHFPPSSSEYEVRLA